MVSFLLVEQAGRRFVANNIGSSDCRLPSWTGGSRASLRPLNFSQLDGPACAAGATCPDFSASAPPLRFGFWRVAFGLAGEVVTHGIDNWRVTVWPQ